MFGPRDPELRRKWKSASLKSAPCLFFAVILIFVVLIAAALTHFIIAAAISIPATFLMIRGIRYARESKAFLRLDQSRQWQEAAEATKPVLIETPPPAHSSSAAATADPGAASADIPEGEFYVLSGRRSSVGSLVTLAFGLVGAAVLAPAFAGLSALLELAVEHMPISVVAWLAIACAYGLGIGWVMRFGVTAGHVRSRSAIIFCSIVVGLIAWVGGNILFVAFMQEGRHIPPDRYIQFFTSEGWRLIFALINLGLIPYTILLMAIPRRSYCENCLRWADRLRVGDFSVIYNPQTFVEAILLGRLDVLDQLEPVSRKNVTAHTRIAVDRCPHCGFRVLWVEMRAKIAPDRAGELERFREAGVELRAKVAPGSVGKDETPHNLHLIDGLIVDSKALDPVIDRLMAKHPG